MDRKEILRNPNGFDLSSLSQFIQQGIVTYSELCDYGLRASSRPDLLNMIIEPLWQNCLQTNTKEAYQDFLNTYPASSFAKEAKDKIDAIIRDIGIEETFWQNALNDNNIHAFNAYIERFPNGKHVADAYYRIDLLKGEVGRKKRILFDEIRENPSRFDKAQAKQLLQGGHPNFNGVEITFEELQQEGLITSDAYRTIMNGNDVTFNQLDINSLPSLPERHTDIYFFGIPKSGKSSVLSGIIFAANQGGHIRYMPQFTADRVDPNRDYFDSLIECLTISTPPPSTGDETANFMTIALRQDANNVNGNENLINFIELGGEFFLKVTNGLIDVNNKVAIQGHGVTSYLKNNNRKVLFFVIDFSKNFAFNSNTSNLDDTSQMKSLSRAIHVFGHDGEGVDGAKNCTFSKTDSIVIIVTKADLMGVESREERLVIAKEYINNVYKSFVNDIKHISNKFGINKNYNFSPLVTTFSLGKFMLANTVDFNPNDSIQIIDTIKGLTRTTQSGSSLKELIKNILSSD